MGITASLSIAALKYLAKKTELKQKVALKSSLYT